MSTTKICSKCRQEKPASAFSPRKDRPVGLYSMCKDCKAKSRSKRYFERRENDPVPQWIVNVRNWAKFRAKKHGIVFALSIEDVEKALEECGGRCPYCGKPFEFRGTMKDRKSSPSLDRIVPNHGYIARNLTVCCYRCNQMKSEATPEEIWRMAHKLTEMVKERGL